MVVDWADNVEDHISDSLSGRVEVLLLDLLSGLLDLSRDRAEVVDDVLSHGGEELGWVRLKAFNPVGDSGEVPLGVLAVLQVVWKLSHEEAN